MWNYGSGWVTENEQRDMKINSNSRLAHAKAEIERLELALDTVEGALSSDLVHNIYLTRGDEIIAELAGAAVETKRGEHQFARNNYQSVLRILAEIDEADLGDLDRELLFAIHALLGESYLQYGSMSYAYAEFIEAFGQLSPDDAKSREYLWLRLADFFIRWGDQLYATAGTDYRARLIALDRYAKVAAPVMCLTYDDGAEDEVLDLWIDLALGDGSVPADPESWLRSLNVAVFLRSRLRQRGPRQPRQRGSFRPSASPSSFPTGVLSPPRTLTPEGFCASVSMSQSVVSRAQDSTSQHQFDECARLLDAEPLPRGCPGRC